MSNSTDWTWCILNIRTDSWLAILLMRGSSSITDLLLGLFSTETTIVSLVNVCVHCAIYPPHYVCNRFNGVTNRWWIHSSACPLEVILIWHSATCQPPVAFIWEVLKIPTQTFSTTLSAPFSHYYFKICLAFTVWVKWGITQENWVEKSWVMLSYWILYSENKRMNSIVSVNDD